MKENLYIQAIKMLSKCYEMKLYNLSLTDILEQMYKTAQIEERYHKANLISQLINEQIIG